MATLLKDGGDLDSVDRSLLDCETLANEKSFKVPPLGMRADIASLDPGQLSLMSVMSSSLGAGDGASLHRLKCSRDSCSGNPLSPPLLSSSSTSSNSTGANVRTIATKLVRIVSPSPRSRNVDDDSDRNLLCPGNKKKRETVVRFSAESNTMLLTSDNKHSNPCFNGSNGVSQLTGKKLTLLHQPLLLNHMI